MIRYAQLRSDDSSAAIWVDRKSGSCHRIVIAERSVVERPAVRSSLRGVSQEIGNVWPRGFAVGASNGSLLPPRLRSMPPFGSPPASCLRRTNWIAPGVLIAATLLLALVSVVAARKAIRVALLPLACTWLLLGVLLSEIEPAPDPQTQLSLIADAGGATAVDGEVTRTTPIRLTQSTSALRQYHAGRTERESGSAGGFRGRPPGGRRPARHPLRPRGSTIPCHPLRRPDPRPDRDAPARALSRPRGLGCHRVAAPAGHRGGGLAQSLRRLR